MKRKQTPETDLNEIIPLLIGVWRRYVKEAGPPDRLQTREFRRMVEAIQVLQQGSKEGHSLIGQDYFAQPDLLAAYMLYHWILHYQEGLSLLGELPTTPRRVLDVASGPAAFAFAALRHGASDVFATDRNETALKLGAEVCGRYGYPLNVRKWDCLKANLPIDGSFDLIILGHCLHELFPANQKNWVEGQHAFVTMLLNRLSPQGFLVIVDQSYVESNRRVLQLRDRMVKEGIAVQAPCVWRGECPALKTANSPCYAQRELEKPYLIKEFQRAAQINLSSLKMSYVILRSPQATWPELPEKALYRVISPPVDSFQGKRYYLCGIDGKKNLGSHLDPVPKSARAFAFLKRGELISIENALEKQQALDIVQETSVTVEAACGKPVAEKETDDAQE